MDAEEKVEALFRELGRYGYAPHLMLSLGGFTARVGVGGEGRFESFRAPTAYGALQGLVRRLRRERGGK